jgi:hypothetical protein
VVTVLRTIKNEQYRRQCERERMRIDREVVARPAPGIGATAPGDARRLRGIPCIAAGVRGASPGSRPGENLGLFDPDDDSDLTRAVSNPTRSHVRWDVEAWSSYYEGENP